MHFFILLIYSHKLNKSDLEDKIGNHILSLLQTVNGGVIVSSELLENYIRINYPNIKIHASVIQTAFHKRDVNYYLTLSNNFDHYVIHPDDNFNYDLLKKIPKENAEIILNERCYMNCCQRAEHYDSISNEQKSLAEGNFSYEHFLDKCPAIPEFKQLTSEQRNLSSTLDEFDQFVELGFQLFKLQGRTDDLYAVFFDIMRYTLDNTIAFPALYPLFCSEIQKHLKKQGRQ